MAQETDPVRLLRHRYIKHDIKQRVQEANTKDFADVLEVWCDNTELRDNADVQKMILAKLTGEGVMHALQREPIYRSLAGSDRGAKVLVEVLGAALVRMDEEHSTYGGRQQGYDAGNTVLW